MLGLSTLSGSNAESPHHVYELRLYHVNEGKINALRDRFGNYTDAIFKRHNMKSIGYWSPEDAPEFAEPAYLHSGASQPSRGGEELDRFPSRSGNGRGLRPHRKRTGRWWIISTGISWIQPAFQP